MMYIGLFCLGFLLGFVCSIGGCLVILKGREDGEAMGYEDDYEYEKKM